MNRDLAFLVSPSLGIIDNWLPVICEIARRQPDRRICLIIPRPQSVEELSTSSALVRIADGVVDSVIWKSLSGDWVQSQGIMATLSAIRSQGAVALRARQSWNRLKAKVVGHKTWHEEKFLTNSIDLIYDVYEEDKNFTKDFIRSVRAQNAYSLHHGINVIDGGRSPKSLPGFEARNSKLQPLTFLFSEMEKPYYMETYGLMEDRIRVVGIPRHDPPWIERLQDEDRATLDDLPPRFIGLISRPQNAKYLPIERKIKSLEALRDVAGELGIPIVLKKHPKLKDKVEEQQLDDGIYAKVFGKENEGKTWYDTKAHWLALGSRCVFAMSLYSGVVTDMAALGVPTVEWLDLRDLPWSDNATSLREADGTPVLSYRYLGLVAGASSKEELRRFARNSVDRREETVAPMIERYRAAFGDPSGAIGRVADAISG
ncbi:MAG: hypothetical protein ACE368_06525 [Paracoccaceae bacterium]